MTDVEFLSPRLEAAIIVTFRQFPAPGVSRPFYRFLDAAGDEVARWSVNEFGDVDCSGCRAELGRLELGVSTGVAHGCERLQPRLRALFDAGHYRDVIRVARNVEVFYLPTSGPAPRLADFTEKGIRLL